MAQDNKPLTSEAPASNTTSRLDLPTLLSDLYAALLDWGRRHKKLTEKVAARILLHEITELQPEFCRGKTWPKWVPILKKIRKGERTIGSDAEERRDPPPGEPLTLLDHLTLRFPLAWAAGRAESWIEEQLNAFSGELQFPPLWNYVVERLKKKCGLLFDDPKFPDFADRLEEYCGDNDNDRGFKLQDRELLSARIAELDKAGFADDLLAELWTQFPRECERLGLPAGLATHSPDFRTVRWRGDEISFTKQQAAIVKKLWEAWENHTPDVGFPALLETADAKTSRLIDSFRDHPAWGTMIINGKTKGTKRIAGEPPPS